MGLASDHRWVLGLVSALAACGGSHALPVAADAAATGGDAAGRGDSICRSADWARAEQPVLALAVDRDVVFVSADGTRSTAYRFADELSGISLLPYGRFIAATRQAKTSAGGRYDLVLIDSGGAVKWSYAQARPAPTRIDQQIYLDQLFVAANGAAALAMYRAPSVAILPDGRNVELPGMVPIGPPDDAGWLPVHLESATNIFGFVRAGETTPNLLRWPLAASALGSVQRVGSHLVYLSFTADGVALADETPMRALSWLLGVSDDRRVGLRAAGEKVIVTFDGLPRWLWQPTAETLIDVALEGSAGVTDAFIAVASNRALVGGGGVPRWLVDLDTGASRTLDAAGLRAPGRAVDLRASVEGRWVLGVEGGRPVWRVDAVTGEIVGVELAPPPAPQPFTAQWTCAGTTAVLPDGRLAVSLRDASSGGLFVGGANPTDAPWTRIGRSVAAVAFIDARRTGDTWIMKSVAPENTFCSPGAPWAPPPPDAPRPLDATSMQVVVPGREPLIIPSGTTVSLDRSGRCALIGPALHDLGTGERTELGTTAVWLPE